MKLMQPEDIPGFIQAVIETGCEPTAVVGVGYVIGDADLPPRKQKAVRPVLRKICKAYGERDHLLREITDYLISIGRYYPLVQRH